MDEIRNRINTALENNDIGIDLENTISEALEKLLIYHEELRFQNEELKRTNELIGKLKHDYEILFIDAPVSYLILDEDMNIKKFNNAAKRIFETDELLDKSLTKFVHENSQDDLYFFKKKISSDREYLLTIDLNIDSIIKNVKIHANSIQSSDKELYRFTLIDETLLREQIREIEYLSYYDQLTGAYNRNYLLKILDKLDDEKKYPIGIIMLDLNGLKIVNDTFGHTIGDELLAHTVRVAKNIIGPNDILARVGSDEFIIVLPETEELNVRRIMRQLRSKSDSIQIKDLNLSIAYGYAMKTSEKLSINDLLKDAENHMNKDKLLNRTSQRKAIIDSIIATLHEKHPREQKHSYRVEEYAVMVGKKLDFDHEKMLALRTAAILHDIGKIAIDYSIINKPAKLTDSEYEEVKRHPAIGYRILSSSGIFCDVANIVIAHHERIDGKGYPKGLKGDEISQSAKIISVCDAYDAMISERPYREPLSKEEAIEELIAGKNKQFDEDIVDIFIDCI